MTTFATVATLATLVSALLAHASPALADPAPAPRLTSLKIRFSIQDAKTNRTFDVMVSGDGPCAAASQKLADQQFELSACASRGPILTIDWLVRSGADEYHSTSSIPFEHGATAELGSTTAPRITVKID